MIHPEDPQDVDIKTSPCTPRRLKAARRTRTGWSLIASFFIPF
jgi:hypothetical protein